MRERGSYNEHWTLKYIRELQKQATPATAAAMGDRISAFLAQLLAELTYLRMHEIPRATRWWYLEELETAEHFLGEDFNTARDILTQVRALVTTLSSPLDGIDADAAREIAAVAARMEGSKHE